MLGKTLATMLLALGLTTTMSAPTFAGIALNTIDPVAVVTDDGRQLRITGPIACTTTERVTLQVTVTQRTTGAVAQGRAHFLCTGQLQHWDVWVTHDGPESFEEGAATAVALARTRVQGKPTDVHQWLVDVTLAQ
jgi:hypothetical protein